MLRSAFDAVMERRALRLLEQLAPWLPANGPVLDVGSGTGHLAAGLERELGIEAVTCDVTDLHVVGPAPVPITGDALPFAGRSFSAALLCFMLAYPTDPVAVLREAARVTRGPVIVVQTLYRGRLARLWHRGREFAWTVVAFHVSKLVGYIPRDSEFTMRTLRFYTADELERVVAAAGLRLRSRRERPVLPGGALVVAAWALEEP